VPRPLLCFLYQIYNKLDCFHNRNNRKASAIETSKFAPESGVSLNMSFMPGTYITNSDKRKP